MFLIVFLCACGVNAAEDNTCKANCHGRTCDEWVAMEDGAKDCKLLEDNLGCDCSSCTCGNEPNTCAKQDGCFGHSCTFWSDTHKLTCDTLETFYKCDCAKCACESPFDTYKTPENGVWEKIGQSDCISHMLSGNLPIGEGYTTNGYQTFDRWTVDQCKIKCAKHPDCKGFNYDHNNGICRYKRIGRSHRIQHDDGTLMHDCFLFKRTDPDTTSVSTTTTITTEASTQRFRPVERPKRCNEVDCGGTSHCMDGEGGFTCFCAAGWIGGGLNRLCEDVNECVGVDCGGKSVCFNGLNLYTCMCEEGWSGGGDNKVCKANHCTCEHGTPGEAESCPVDGESKCVACDHGYDLQMDDTCVDDCASKTCSGHGKCYAGKCYCNAPYTGTDCEVMPDPCATTNCGSHGRCFSGTCFCEDFYTGDNCEHPPGANGGIVVVHG